MAETELTTPSEPTSRVERGAEQRDRLRQRARQARAAIDAMWEDRGEAAKRALEEWEAQNGS